MYSTGAVRLAGRLSDGSYLSEGLFFDCHAVHTTHALGVSPSLAQNLATLSVHLLGGLERGWSLGTSSGRTSAPLHSRNWGPASSAQMKCCVSISIAGISSAIRQRGSLRTTRYTRSHEASVDSSLRRHSEEQSPKLSPTSCKLPMSGRIVTLIKLVIDLWPFGINWS